MEHSELSRPWILWLRWGREGKESLTGKERDASWLVKAVQIGLVQHLFSNRPFPHSGSIILFQRDQRGRQREKPVGSSHPLRSSRQFGPRACLNSFLSDRMVPSLSPPPIPASRKTNNRRRVFGRFERGVRPEQLFIGKKDLCTRLLSE